MRLHIHIQNSENTYSNIIVMRFCLDHKPKCVPIDETECPCVQINMHLLAPPSLCLSGSLLGTIQVCLQVETDMNYDYYSKYVQ